MKTVFEEASAPQDLEISSAEYISGYKLLATFNDGIQQKIDFGPFLKKAKQSLTRQYLDKKLFKEFQVIDGNINWHDYSMIFPVEQLHEGKIS